MKKIICKILATFIFSSWLFYSCKKKDDSQSPSGSQPAIRATIGTRYWYSDSVSCTVDSGSPGEIYIAGSNIDKSIVMIDLPLHIQPGFYSLKETSLFSMYYEKTRVNFIPLSGNVFITNNSNKTIAGTFSGHIPDVRGVDSVTVSSGSFKITYY